MPIRVARDDLLELLNEHGSLRPGPHQAHIPHEDIYQLRQLIYGEAADEDPQPGTARILLDRPNRSRPILGSLLHGPELRHLERLGGGIGTRGPGETQLETDRRLIQRRIHRLKSKIDDMRKHRQLYRQQRKKTGIPIVAIVGYTNAGKSTLLNALSHADAFVEDKLFATLDPTTKRLTLPDRSTVLLTDTVGFIRKLPPAIVTAFKATLEELAEADVLLHVVDLTSHNAPEQCQIVEDILADLDLMDKPRITALNKIDLLLDDSRKWDETSAIDYLSHRSEVVGENTVLVSAVKRWGLGQLRELISQTLAQTVPST